MWLAIAWTLTFLLFVDILLQSRLDELKQHIPEEEITPLQIIYGLDREEQ